MNIIILFIGPCYSFHIFPKLFDGVTFQLIGSALKTSLKVFEDSLNKTFVVICMYLTLTYFYHQTAVLVLLYSGFKGERGSVITGYCGSPRTQVGNTRVTPLVLQVLIGCGNHLPSNGTAFLFSNIK